MTRRAAHPCPTCGTSHNCETDLCARCRPAPEPIGLGPGRWVLDPVTRIVRRVPRGQTIEDVARASEVRRMRGLFAEGEA